MGHNTIDTIDSQQTTHDHSTATEPFEQLVTTSSTFVRFNEGNTDHFVKLLLESFQDTSHDTILDTNQQQKPELAGRLMVQAYISHYIFKYPTELRK